MWQPMHKIMLLGMNNPLSDDPAFDLYPYPEGSTGYRLWKMLPEGTTRAQYIAAFDRMNLLRARRWDAAAAREAGEVLLPSLAGRVVVVFGTEVRKALGFRQAEPLSFHEDDQLRWVAFPHPSGLNRWFNDPDNYARACSLFEQLRRASEGGIVDAFWRNYTHAPQ